MGAAGGAARPRGLQSLPRGRGGSARGARGRQEHLGGREKVFEKVFVGIFRGLPI